MPTLHSRELRAAREAFNTHGRIPYDNAVRLMSLGFIVHMLEDTWARLGDR